MRSSITPCPGISGSILLGLCLQVSHIYSFSLSSLVQQSVTRNVKTNTIHNHDTYLGMSKDSITDETLDLSPGTIIIKRYLHRLSSVSSAIQTPYTIEERQNYSVEHDKSLVSVGEMSLIIRGPASHADATTDNGKPLISVGPALHTIEGLQMESSDLVSSVLGDSSWGSSYAMALFSMEHSGVVTGSGLEVGR
jgi:hypothetical protein